MSVSVLANFAVVLPYIVLLVQASILNPTHPYIESTTVISDNLLCCIISTLLLCFFSPPCLCANSFDRKAFYPSVVYEVYKVKHDGGSTVDGSLSSHHDHFPNSCNNQAVQSPFPSCFLPSQFIRSSRFYESHAQFFEDCYLVFS